MKGRVGPMKVMLTYWGEIEARREKQVLEARKALEQAQMQLLNCKNTLAAREYELQAARRELRRERAQ